MFWNTALLLGDFLDLRGLDILSTVCLGTRFACINPFDSLSICNFFCFQVRDCKVGSLMHFILPREIWQSGDSWAVWTAVKS